MINPLIISLAILSASAYRSLSIARTRRELLDLCIGREIEVQGIITDVTNNQLTLLIDGINLATAVDTDTQLYAKITQTPSGLRPGDSVAGPINCNFCSPLNGLLYGRASSKKLIYRERPPPTYPLCITTKSAVMRSQYISVFKELLSSDAYALVCPLLFGTTGGGAYSRNLAESWGILHLLARSGLHLMILLWVLRRSTALIPMRPSVVHGITWILLCMYTAVTFASFSYVRALCMGLWGSLFALWDRRTDQYGIWIYGCSTVIALFPEAIFAIDFQLSALATLALLAEASFYRRKGKSLDSIP